MNKIIAGQEMQREDLQELSSIGATMESFGIPAEGEYKDYFFEVDENYEVTIIGKLKGEKPSIHAEIVTTGLSLTVEIKVTASITGGNIASIEATNGATLKTDTSETEKVFEVSANGTYYFKTKADNGRSAIASVVVNTIIEKPIIEIKDITYTEFTIVVTNNYSEGLVTEYKYYVEGTLKRESTTDTQYVVTGLAVGTEYTNIYVEAYIGEEKLTSDTKTVTTGADVAVWTNNTTEIRTIDGGEATYQNPIIPIGFSAMNTPNTKWNLTAGSSSEWNEGLVIQDASGNQFVWIPVNDYETFINDEDFGSNKYTDDATDENYELMIESVKKNQGFYIGRYEVGQSNISQRNEKILIKVTKAQIETNCESYAYNSSELICSGLYGVQWDAVLRFIAQNAPTYNLNNSFSWGNYNGTQKLVTGYTCRSYSSGTWVLVENQEGTYGLIGTGLIEKNQVLNIYDFAGNIIELTLEGNGVGRGGGHEDDGTGNYSASGRVTSGRFGYRASFIINNM